MKSTLLSLLLFVYSIITAQVKPPITVKEYEEGINPVDEIRLFDLQEIKSRKIDTAYVIYHPASWIEDGPKFTSCNCTYNDTLEMYRFDTEGRIVQRTRFAQLGNYSTTWHYDTSGKAISIDSYRRIGIKAGTSTFMFPTDISDSKPIVNTKKTKHDSTVTEITFWKFKHGLDTAFIIIKKFNWKGILVEVQSEVNKRNEREIGDDTGESTYHFKYDYDDKGRLVYYQNLMSDEYKKITYPFYGKLTEVYSTQTNTLKSREVKLIDNNRDGTLTITYGRKQVILTPFEKDSRLYKLQTIIEPGPTPLLEYHEIVYKKQ